MNPIDCFGQSIIGYIKEIFVPVLLGFLFSGIIHEFVSDRLVQKYFGNGSLTSVFHATWIGALLPVCCVGSLPIAITLRQKGARLGPVLAFLVATPATSLPALLVSLKLMGVHYTIYMTLTVIVMGLIIGIVGNFFGSVEPSPNNSPHSCCHNDVTAYPKRKGVDLKTVRSILHYALVELPQKIGTEILIGAVVASVIVSFDAVRDFVRMQLSGFKGYLILVVVGLIDYVCSTASVPVANALTHSGVSLGKSMVYLLMGPITSYATILVIRKEFGNKVLAVYLLVISVVSVSAGWFYDAVLRSNFMG